MLIGGKFEEVESRPTLFQVLINGRFEPVVQVFLKVVRDVFM